MTNEAEWVESAIAGDQNAFGRLVQAYQTPIYNLAYRMLGTAVEAEDAAQEVFLRAYTRFRSYDPERPFRPWLFSIASHYCIDRLRKRRLHLVSLEDDKAVPHQPASSNPGPEAVVSQREQEKLIRSLMAQLAPTDRAAVTLRYWYDCSYEEIAEMLNLTVSAVKSRLHRARRALAEMMLPAEDAPPEQETSAAAAVPAVNRTAQATEREANNALQTG